MDGSRCNGVTSGTDPGSPIILGYIGTFLFNKKVYYFNRLLGALCRGTNVDKSRMGTTAPYAVVVVATVLAKVNIFSGVTYRTKTKAIIPVAKFTGTMISPTLRFGRRNVILNATTRVFSVTKPIVICKIKDSFVCKLVVCIFGLCWGR